MLIIWVYYRPEFEAHLATSSAEKFESMTSQKQQLDVGRLVDEILFRGQYFHPSYDNALWAGIEACEKVGERSESDPLYRIPADKLYYLPVPAVVAGHDTRLLSEMLGSVFLVFPGRLAAEFAAELALEEDVEREVGRPTGLSGLLEVYMENPDGSLTEVDESDIDAYLEQGRIFDNLYYRTEESPHQVSPYYVNFRVLLAWESSRFPGFTLLGTQYGSYMNELGLEALERQEEAAERAHNEERAKINAEINDPVDPEKVAAMRAGESNFFTRRRQRFLPEKYFKATSHTLAKVIESWRKEMARSSDDEYREMGLDRYARHLHDLWLLRYTGGEPLEVLRQELEPVVAAQEELARCKAKVMEVEAVSPFDFTDIDDYERMLQQLSLCILLHREDLLMRMAALVDASYNGQDTIVEDLLAFYMEERYDVDQWYHDEPYSTLVHAIYEEDQQEAASKLERYCTEWYAGMERAQWSDSHLRIQENDSYVGYWAFEAAAVSYLMKIDDSNFDHMVYPRDLVDFARASGTFD